MGTPPPPPPPYRRPAAAPPPPPAPASRGPVSEHEKVLQTLHPVFRQVDAMFQKYIEVIAQHPDWDDVQIDKELLRRGVPAENAEDLIVFIPLAFGREVVEQLGVSISEQYDCGGQMVPLANEIFHAWGRQVAGAYRTQER